MTPSGWKVKPLATVLERVAEQIDPSPDDYYREIGIRSHGKGIFHEPPVIGKELGDKRVFRVIPDCFVVNIVFAWEQAVARTTSAEAGMIASHRFPMYRAKAGACDIDFLTYYFKSKKGKHLLEIASPGGAGRNKTLGQKEFERLSFCMPSASEQARIGLILGTWDKAIELTEQLIGRNEALKRAVVQQLLTGKRRLPGWSEPWRKFRLSKVAEVLVSGVDKKSNDGELPIRLCNYTDVYHHNYLTNDMQFMSATATQLEIDKFSLRQNDVVITKDSEAPEDIAVPAFVRDAVIGVVCGYHLAIIRPKSGVLDGAFLACLFSLPEIRYHFYSLANGATRFGLSVGAIASTVLSLPVLEEQAEIARRMMLIDDEAKNLSAQLLILKDQRKALMQQLLTGKRRVKLESAA